MRFRNVARKLLAIGSRIRVQYGVVISWEHRVEGFVLDANLIALFVGSSSKTLSHTVLFDLENTVWDANLRQ